jgi:hypothetical protein
MTNRTNKTLVTEQRNEKPVEKRGFPPPPPRPAIADLRFMVKESLKLGSKIIAEINQAIRIIKE